MTGLVFGILFVWAGLATIEVYRTRRQFLEVTLSLASINLVLDKLEKHVQPLATLKATLDKERYDREKMALIQGDEDRRDWKSV